HQAEIQLALDVEPLLDEQTLDDASFGPSLMRDERHAEHLRRRRFGLGRALHDLDTAALAAAAGMNLRFDDHDTAAEPLRGRLPVIRRRNRFACGNGNAVLRKDGLALELVNLHAGRILSNSIRGASPLRTPRRRRSRGPHDPRAAPPARSRGSLDNSTG